MLVILWLIVWAIVGEAFYNEYNWDSFNDGFSDAFASQRNVQNFSETLRSFAATYRQEGDEVLTLGKAKQRLRKLKVFKLTGSPKDFEPSRGFLLPLLEAALYCTMGRYTKVDCNYCTCVAGQLYMCTGMKCPTAAVPERPQFLTTCREGAKRQIDSCNYCLCRNGHEICSTRDCGHNHEDPRLLRARNCYEGTQSEVDCNRCVCHRGQQYCTSKDCRDFKKHKAKKLKLMIETEINVVPLGDCYNGQKVRERCRICKCINSQWRCSDKYCFKKKQKENLPWPNCRNGETRKIDACTVCTCHNEHEHCKREAYCDFEDEPNHRRFDDNERQCVEESYYQIDSCNYCMCLYGSLTCTAQPCTDETESASMPICSDGSTLQYDPCNYCTCQNGDYVCTNFPCAERTTKNKDFLRRKQVCEPSKIRWTKCTKCVCIGYRWSCTMLDTCVGSSWTQSENFKKNSTLLPKKVCEKGETRKVDECNTCICHKGQWSCETQDCNATKKNDSKSGKQIPVIKKSDLTKFIKDLSLQIEKSVFLIDYETYKKFKKRKNIGEIGNADVDDTSDDKLPADLPANCVQGQGRVVDCYPCFCISPEKGWQCYKKRRSKQCMEKKNKQNKPPNRHIFRSNTCVEGGRREVNPCNYCICRYGAEFCTQKPCWRDSYYFMSSSEAECFDGESVVAQDTCNTCICYNSDILCTNNPCILRSENKDSDCVEGQKKKMPDGCNFCVCRGGQEFCTARACLTLDHNVEQTGCTEREVIPAKDKCNMCICIKEKIVCTNKDCSESARRAIPYKQASALLRANPYRFPQRCVEFEPLPSEEPCNSCMCFNGRKVCTIYSCLEDTEDLNLGSLEALFVGHKKFNNNQKKKKDFCEPFTFFSPDNNRICRNCFCLHNGLALCLLNLCKYSKDIRQHQHLPEVLSDVCQPGDIGYPTKCISCVCSEFGKWLCSREDLALCQERDCDEKDEFRMGFHPYCAGCKCSVKEWFCSVQSKPCDDYSNTTCPLGTFIYNPKQLCSICLCGGNEKGTYNMCFTEAKCIRHVINH